MRAKDVKDFIEGIVESDVGINGNDFNWIQDVLNDNPNKDLPFFALMPFESTESVGTGVIEFRTVFYLMDTNRADSGEGDLMTGDQKAAKWDELDIIIDRILKKINDQTYQISELGARRITDVRGVNLHTEAITSWGDLTVQCKLTLKAIKSRC